MQNRQFSPGFTALILAFIAAGVFVYQSNKKDRELIALNETKSQLTDAEEAPKKPGLQEIIKKNLARQEEAQNPLPAQENVLMRERLYTESELNEMSEGQFEELLKDTERKLPRVSDLKKLPAGALHRTPPAVIQAGRDLGVIREVLKIHESYDRIAAPFYKSCASDNEGVTPVRALCLTNLIEIKKKNGETLNLKEFPNQLIELSKMVTEI